MNVKTSAFALSLLMTCFNSSLLAQKTLLHCGKMIDVKSGKTLSQMTITVEGDEIVALQDGYQKPGKNNVVIDLTQKVVMPGLIDMHVHLENETSKDNYIKKFTLNEADLAFNASLYAKKTLMAGFTTVRDLGGTGVNISLRRAIERGVVVGPRVYTSGKSIASTGGHGDPTNGYKKDLMGDPGPREGVVNGVADARKAVRQRYKDGADLIKITATGGVLSVAKDGQGPQFTLEELKAIISTAKDYGMTVAAHAHGAEGMKRAVMAGVTSIEHGTKMTEEVMDLMIARGTYLVPTISAGRAVADSAKIPGYYHALVVPKALEIGPIIQNTFGKAYQKGVKIAFGTDAGVFPHGQNGKEFAYMVEAGMPPMEAIQCATLHAATLLGEEDSLGSIEVGMLADIVAVDEDPAKNIRTMENVTFIMKDGVVYKSK